MEHTLGNRTKGRKYGAKMTMLEGLAGGGGKWPDLTSDIPNSASQDPVWAAPTAIASRNKSADRCLDGPCLHYSLIDTISTRKDVRRDSVAQFGAWTSSSFGTEY